MARDLRLVIGLAVGLAAGHSLTGAGTPAANGQAGAAPAGPRYTVVQTDILSALVVDNAKNEVFFYTTEPNAEPGADLHLRGTLDLNDVGKPVLKPKKADKK
jgi:hypothetical protein